jgi:hypothetical protein
MSYSEIEEELNFSNAAAEIVNHLIFINPILSANPLKIIKNSI